MLPVYIAVFFFGASMGSFAAAAYSRILRLFAADPENDSVFFALLEPSSCFSCGLRLRWYHMIPAASWAYLGGRCARCGASFGRGALYAELFGGAFAALAFFLFSPAADIRGYGAFLLYGFAAAFLFIGAATDMKTGYLWDDCSFSAVALCCGFLAVSGRYDLLHMHCAVGWIAFMASHTGKVGSGDAAPLACFAALSAYFAPYGDVYEIFRFFLFFILCTCVSFLVCFRISRGRNPDRSGIMGEKAPLVPHMALAYAIVVAFAAGAKIFGV